MRFLRSAALALLLTATGLPALAQATLATDRYAPSKLLEFWRGHGPGTTIGDDPSENAPGWFRDEPVLHVHQPSSGPRITAAETDLLKRRLDVAFKALMSQPSLKDIRGASLSADVNVSVLPTGNGRRLVSATLRLGAKKIILGDPKTFALQGRYQTPWLEAAPLRVTLNPYEVVSGRDMVADGVSGRILSVRAGTTRGLLITDAPYEAEWAADAVAEKLAGDHSWYKPGAPGEHPLLVTYSSYRQENQQLADGTLEHTAPVARLAAAVWMVDWAAVQSQMAALR